MVEVWSGYGPGMGGYVMGWYGVVWDGMKWYRMVWDSGEYICKNVSYLLSD